MLSLSVGSLRGLRGVQFINHPENFRADRGTVVGNPFDMECEERRDAVCEGFKRYLWRIHKGMEPVDAARIVSNELGLNISDAWDRPTRQGFMDAIAYLWRSAKQQHVTAYCWCAPRRCHVEILIEYVKWLDTNTDAQLELSL